MLNVLLCSTVYICYIILLCFSFGKSVLNVLLMDPPVFVSFDHSTKCHQARMDQIKAYNLVEQNRNKKTTRLQRSVSWCDQLTKFI